MSKFKGRFKALFLAVGAVIAGSVNSAQAVIYDTTPSWDGSAFVQHFGIPDTQTYGQTITAPLIDNSLTSFTFQMKLPTSLAFRGEVYAWDGTKATGPSLYESSPISTSNSAIFEPITFNTGGVTLTPGAQYVLFASSSKDNPGHSGQGMWGQPQNQNLYTGGQFVFLNNGVDASQWLSTPWSQGFLGADTDTAFQATFTNTVPEPGSVGLLCAAAMFTYRRRRARR